jgi:hypothetical protein
VSSSVGTLFLRSNKILIKAVPAVYYCMTVFLAELTLHPGLVGAEVATATTTAGAVASATATTAAVSTAVVAATGRQIC